MSASTPQVLTKPYKASNKGAKKVLKITGLSILALVLVLILAVSILFGGEILTILSIKQAGQPDFYTMEYKGDYGLDKLLENGVATDGELITFISGQLLKGIPLKFDLPDLGCSTFAAETPDGDRIFGRNFDNKYTPVMVLTTKPKNGYASISVVNLSFLGYGENNYPSSPLKSILAMAAPYAPLDGINEKGLCIGVLQIDTDPTVQDTGKTPITTTSAIRMVLDKAATVDEAIELLQQYDMRSSANGCYHFQIADASGKSVVVEYIENEFVVIETDHATNFLLQPGPWFNFGGGQDRYDILDSTLAEKDGVLTEQEGMALLQSVRQKTEASSTPTQWSSLYNSTKKTLSICIGMNYEEVYEYSMP